MDLSVFEGLEQPGVCMWLGPTTTGWQLLEKVELLGAADLSGTSGVIALVGSCRGPYSSPQVL